MILSRSAIGTSDQNMVPSIYAAEILRKVQMNQSVGDLQPDWSREALHPGEWNLGKRLLASLRDYQRQVMSGSWWSRQVLLRLAVLRHRLWRAVSGADIQLSSLIERGLVLPHTNGVVIFPDVRIGSNCTIFQQMTLGTRCDDVVCPVIGGRAEVGAGAKLLGGITIGAHAVIGANAVVVTDVPAGATAVGIPAKILPRKQ